MATFKKDLRLGSILETTGGEYYVYLGVYAGIVDTLLFNVCAGYLYLRLGDKIPKDLHTPESWVRNNLWKMRNGEKCHVSYVKNPKNFKRMVFVQSMSAQEIIQLHPYSLKFIGEK